VNALAPFGNHPVLHLDIQCNTNSV